VKCFYNMSYHVTQGSISYLLTSIGASSHRHVSSYNEYSIRRVARSMQLLR